uniref:Mediator of RNA polymerase II transcription subunit 29 n=1 Tax=Pristionchus pacificus TaxID=54126 RepID=A0A8R1YW36_PRIPA
MYQQQQDDPSQQQGSQPMQMSYGISGMGQSNDLYMQQGQHYPMNAAPSGMNPHVYNSISSSLQARSPYSMGGMGGPQSIPQPMSVNPLSVPPQGPGSVSGQGPMSVPQQGPASVQGPMSVPQQGPCSVPGQGPLSVPQPLSMAGQGPLSVPQPLSMAGQGPLSVPQPGSVGQSGDSLGIGGLTVPGVMHSNQGPSPSSLSIPSHMGSYIDGQGRSPIGPGSMSGPSPCALPQGTSPSLGNPLSHGGPQSISAFNPSTPHNVPSQSQEKKDEESERYDGIFLLDPMQQSKQLITKDLRVSFSEMNKSMGEVLRNRDNVSVEQNEKYNRDYNEFMAVCDQVEQALTMVLETSKMMSKLDRSYTPDGGNTAGRSNEYSIHPLINYVDQTNAMTSNVECTVSGVFDMMTKIRKREALYKEKKDGIKEEVKMETD